MSFARVVVAAAIFAMLPIADASAKSATVAAEVNLRKGPGTDTDIITLIPKGSKVEVVKCSNEWCQVSWNGQDGYAIAKNLGLARPRVARLSVPVDEYGPPGAYPGYVVGPPPPYYYGYYGPYWGPGWGWRGGWGRRW